ncbi:MAG TPA: cyclase family protein [Acidimicrobiales bacterium]|jgi:kynurenine formamidase
MFGDIGTIGQLGCDEARSGLSCVVDGVCFGLDWPLDTFLPPISPTRRAVEHHILQSNPNRRDDYLDSFYLQGGTQIDGLRHHRHAIHGFYNFVSDEDVVEGGGRLGIDMWADRGIVGRAVMLDVDAYLLAHRGRGLDQRKGESFPAALFDEVAAWERVELRRGDIVLFRTGWTKHYLEHLSAEERHGLPGNLVSPGLLQERATLQWLTERQVSVIASDNIGVEALPVADSSPFFDIDPDGLMHPAMIALHGMALGELWRLDALAQACHYDGRFDMLLCSKPLYMPGGVGSPANAIAIR